MPQHREIDFQSHRNEDTKGPLSDELRQRPQPGDRDSKPDEEAQNLCDTSASRARPFLVGTPGKSKTRKILRTFSQLGEFVER